jgi:ABC-type sulfate transport system permease subunit
LLSPALVLLLGIVAYPIARAVWLSFHRLEILRPDLTQYVGLDHYRELLQDSVLRIALQNSVVWVVGAVLFQFLGGLIGALILNQRFPGRAIVRGLALIPWATPSVLVALMWTWMLDGNYGLINDRLVKAGILSRFQPWLAESWSALPAVILADVWQGIPFFAVVLLAALQGKPDAETHRQNGIVAAINIGMFTNLEAYKSHVDALVDGIKALPPAEGCTEILVPGEVEDRVHEERAKHGIPLPEGTVRNLRKIADRFKIEMPISL